MNYKELVLSEKAKLEQLCMSDVVKPEDKTKISKVIELINQLENGEIRADKVYEMVMEIDNRTSHEGKVYQSTNDMVRAYGISVRTYRARIKSGLSKKEALCKPVTDEEKAYKVVNSDGMVFDSMEQMLDYYGVSKRVYNKRMQSGWKEKEALGIVEREDDIEKIKVGDKEYSSYAELGEEYGISSETARARVKAGVDMSKETGRGIVQDHAGNVFKSKRKMCRHWGIPWNIFYARIVRGASLKDALTTPYKRRNEVEDHKGKKFKTLKEMSDCYGIKYEVLLSRLRNGWSVKDALTKKVRRMKNNAIL